MENLCESYPAVSPFIPTSTVIHNLIRKAAQLKNETDVLMVVNPKEKKRRINE